MDWSARGLAVAVKCNGTDSADATAIDNERRLYERLLTNPHDNIVAVFGICTDAPDGKVRLVMKLCEKGSLEGYLEEVARREVGAGGGVDFAGGCVSTHDKASTCPPPHTHQPHTLPCFFWSYLYATSAPYFSSRVA
jgi:hypothetical protein